MIRIASDAFDFECGEHVIILGNMDGLIFDSGTYKSFLFATLVHAQNSNRLKSNCRVRLVDSPYTLADVALNSADCVIIDELNFAPNEVNLLLDTVRRANAYLIVIGRIFIKQLEYSVDAIFTFRYSENKFTVRQYFLNSHSQPFHADIAACEDSTSVAGVYSRALGDEVVPVRGRSHFFKFVKKYGTAFLIADKPKFGQDLLDIIYRAKAGDSGIRHLVLFLPDCFEEIVCEVAGAVSLEEEIDYFDREQYYERLAETITQWNKSNVTKSVADICDMFDMGSSEILKDLERYYHQMEVLDDSRCYVIDLDEVNIPSLSQAQKGETGKNP